MRATQNTRLITEITHTHRDTGQKHVKNWVILAQNGYVREYRITLHSDLQVCRRGIVEAVMVHHQHWSGPTPTTHHHPHNLVHTHTRTQHTHTRSHQQTHLRSRSMRGDNAEIPTPA